MTVRCLHAGALVRWNTRANAAPNHTRFRPTHEPRAYNVAADADDADNDDDNNVVYHYDAPMHSYRPQNPCPQCRWHFDSDEAFQRHKRVDHRGNAYSFLTSKTHTNRRPSIRLIASLYTFVSSIFDSILHSFSYALLRLRLVPF